MSFHTWRKKVKKEIGDERKKDLKEYGGKSSKKLDDRLITQYNTYETHLFKRATVFVGVLTIIILGFNSFILFQQAGILEETVQSKTAYIELEVSEYFGDTSYYYLTNILNNIESGKKEQIELNILNIGLMDTGLVVITQREEIENFTFEIVRIENIPAGKSNVSYMNFGVSRKTDLLGSYDILLKVYCEACLDQEQILFRETEIVIRD